MKPLPAQIMNLDLIRNFVIVGQSKNLTDAALKLQKNVSNVSRQIKSLEEILKTPLIIRNGERIKFTVSGEYFFKGYEKAYNLLLLTDKNYLQTGDVNSGKISIGISQNVSSRFLNEKIKSFKQKYPKVVFKILITNSDELYLKLSSVYFDFIIDEQIETKDKTLDTVTKEFILDDFCIAYSKKYYNVDLDNIQQISNLPLILPVSQKKERGLFEQILNQNDIHRNLSIEYTSYETAIDFMKSGYGLALIPKYFLDSNNIDINYIDINMKNEVYLTYIKDTLSVSAEKFLEEFN